MPAMGSLVPSQCGRLIALGCVPDTADEPADHRAVRDAMAALKLPGSMCRNCPVFVTGMSLEGTCLFRMETHPARQRRDCLVLIMLSLGMTALVLVNLGRNTWGNEYYAAGAKSMMSNPKAWFFASFDPASFVSLDKPALGFWLQTLSAAIFGLSGFSLALPQAVAAVISLILLYRMVRRSFGFPAALLTGLAFLTTPIVIATARSNAPDMVLLALLVGSADLLLAGLDRQRPARIILAPAFVGIGFNVKMLQAVVILPALTLVLWCARLSVRRKVTVTLVG